MWEWVTEHTWAAWSAAAVLLAVAEMFSLDLVLLMLATGALGGAVVAGVGGGLALQILVAVAVALGTLVFVRPAVVRRLHGGPTLTTGHAALVGKQAVALEEVTAVSGTVKLAGEVWTARSFDEQAVIPAGATVDVFEIDGAIARVHPTHELS